MRKLYCLHNLVKENKNTGVPFTWNHANQYVSMSWDGTFFSLVLFFCNGNSKERGRGAARCSRCRSRGRSSYDTRPGSNSRC